MTIVSNLATGEPIWIGYGRSAETLPSFLQTLTPEQKSAIELFAMDMHAPFRKAIADNPELKHAVVAHDSFHIMKRAGEALSQLRRAVFFPRTSYVAHDHRARNHQGQDNQLIEAPAANENGVGPVPCRERLGGTLGFYCRDAA